MGSMQQLKKTATSCLTIKADMPMSPLWNMAKAAKRNSANDLKYLQDAINFLTCKAKAKHKFSGDDKEFLKEVYEAFWWGGSYNGYKEAAQLANHYVNGTGNSKAKPLSINSGVYETSKIVIATMDAMKKYITELAAQNKSITSFRCDNVQFRSRPYSKKLTKMNYKTEGKMKPSGVLEAAQNNIRLHRTDGHFYLQALSAIKNSGEIRTTWRIDSLYDFEPFSKQNYYTNIPLGSGTLKLPDGLSEYMTKIGVAKAFWYRAEWLENWRP